jgi:hypothetical protein
VTEELRSPGHYAVIDGMQVKAVWGKGDVWVEDEHGRRVRYDVADVDDLLSVSTRATWRGAEIALSQVIGDECSFYTNSRALAEAENLAGDFYNGWMGAARLDELTDVRVRTTSIHPYRRTS